MALTPEDVSNKRFTTVRLREGYDMTEVDQFLDEVEAELERMTREADELRAKLHSAQTGEPMPEPAPRLKPAKPEPKKAEAAPAEEPAATEGPAQPEQSAQPDQAAQPEQPAAAASPAPAASAGVETLQVTTTAEASVAAARLLELAGNNADALVAEAKQQAEQIVGESKTRAEALESEAKQRAESLEAETEERRKSLLGDLEQEKSGLDAEIERLRTFEREYRGELRTYFQQQLASLDGQGEPGHLSGSPEAQPSGEAASQDGSEGNQG